MESTPQANQRMTNVVDKSESVHGRAGGQSMTTSHGADQNTPTIRHELSSNKLRPKSVDVLEYKKLDLSRIPDESFRQSEEEERHNTGSSAVLGKLKGTAGSVAHRIKAKLPRRRKDGHEDSDTSDDDHLDHDPASSYDLKKLNSDSLPHVSRKPLDSSSTLNSSMDKFRSNDSASTDKHHVDGATKTQLASVGINLDNTTDTLKHTHIAPAVTHETVKPIINEIQTEEITRDVHNTDVFYRIQPVKETVVLPARHFVESLDGKRYEVPESQVQEMVDVNMRQLAEDLMRREKSKPLPPTPNE